MTVQPTEPPPALGPYLTDQHEALWKEADTFAAEYIGPRIARVEAHPDRLDRTLAKLMAARRWFAVAVPASFGGLGGGHLDKLILNHRISRELAAAGAILQASQIPTTAVTMWGTAEQRAWWLPQVADGSVLLSIASTEPEAGGHIGGIETVAERDGDGWVITGSKAHVGNSHLAGAHLVIARTAESGVPTSAALTAFLVESGSKGLTLDRHRRGLGLHGFSFGQVGLDRVRVPDTARVGEVGQGSSVAQSASILCGRSNISAVSLGIHEALVEVTSHNLAHRSRYGRPLSDQPVVRGRLGEMQGRLLAARTLAYAAAFLLDQGRSCDAELINGKYQGHAAMMRTAQDAMELHGATGLTDPVLTRLWRDAPHTYAPAGTGEVQRLRLGDAALGEDDRSWSEHLAALNAWAPADPAPA
ncbi:acyl-CoA dehydrogenase family protein [Streptomyces seoulensis]|uniref:acyl-CoA dehydrogenase family protein n=1 Tax=Streptomyces seoulensis TaxID=73044 RepID=UPI001FCB982E|nr:acyl-CoA dehydrogenase family protein [Streptomyces seoulensis]BDH07147.1 acyl-CoA dehydrogenase [Streptomyces seoulensis]